MERTVGSRGIHATSVIRHLLGRRDREYFKIANIDLLFDTMDDMLLDMGMYTGFICQMFAIGTKGTAVWSNMARKGLHL